MTSEREVWEGDILHFILPIEDGMMNLTLRVDHMRRGRCRVHFERCWFTEPVEVPNHVHEFRLFEVQAQ